MMAAEHESGAGAPSAAAFRSRMLQCAEEMVAAGAMASAETLRESVETWWREQDAWQQEVARMLDVHHEINNALVGVRGHAQLLLLGPAGGDPRVRDRLEVIIRESERIEKAAQQLREVRSRIVARDASRAA